MSLITRCPQCGTSFKVVSDQFRVRNGLVRCGVCAIVFDGRACLLPQPDTLAAAVPAPAGSAAPAISVAPVPPAPAVLRDRDAILRHIGPGAALAPENDDETGEDPRQYDDESAALEQEPADITPGPILGEARTRYASTTGAGRAPPEFLDQSHQQRRGLLRKLWGHACLLGLIALSLQGMYVYRAAIAHSVPALRPALEAACKPLGCEVGYVRRLDRIAITSSSLQPSETEAASDDGRARLILNLTLRNRSAKPQHWPALVLNLMDLSDTVVVRRVLMPQHYLTPGQLRGPFGAADELKISVPITVTGVQVNGYQLDKFFP